MNEFNDTGKKLRANKRVSNYTAYSGYEVHPEPRTQYQELNEKQRKMFEGFKQADERPENMPVKKFINEQQIQPLEKMEDNYTKKLDKINSNYANLDTNINTIMNNDETGIRDKLMNDDKYKSYSEKKFRPHFSFQTINFARIVPVKSRPMTVIFPKPNQTFGGGFR